MIGFQIKQLILRFFGYKIIVVTAALKPIL